MALASIGVVTAMSGAHRAAERIFFPSVTVMRTPHGIVAAPRLANAGDMLIEFLCGSCVAIN